MTRLEWLVVLVSVLVAAPAPRFTGTWTWKSTTADFLLVVREADGKLSGEMTGTALNGNKVTMGAFNGTRTGNLAHIEWRFKEADAIGPVEGPATIQIEKGKLHWKLNYDGVQECWFPRDAVLERKAP